MLLTKASLNDLLREAMPEVCALDRCLGHPHITQLWDICFENNSLRLVFKSWGENLFQALAGFQPSAIVALAHQACDGLQHLHRMCLLHGDLKSANILIRVLEQGSLSIKISDLDGVLAAKPSGRQKVDKQYSRELRYSNLHLMVSGAGNPFGRTRLRD
jgi:serine/threonine protein kinase